MSERLKTRLEIASLAASIVALVACPVVAYATTQAVESHRIQVLETKLERMATALERNTETLGSLDRRLAYIEGRVGEAHP